jgi:RNA recognition motif-containing protein
MGTRLYVGNLTFSTTEDRLRSVFEQTGAQVQSVHMVTDRDTGRPRGFAFVEVGDAAQATAAIEALNGHSVDGRTLTVNEAREREGGRGGGGGGGGGGYGGGGGGGGYGGGGGGGRGGRGGGGGGRY